MSTTIESESFIGRQIDYASEGYHRFTANHSRNYFASESERKIKFSTPEAKPRRSEAKQQLRVLRRFTGFLTEIQGKNARATFVENGEAFQYDMPADNLQKSGIEFVNQPFEMDEVEIAMPDGLVVGYRFRPLATKADAFVETIEFDEDRKRKRDLILKKYSKAKA